METINKVVGLLSVPFMFLNLFGGIVSGIWLAILGEWKLIGIGIGLLLTSHWFLAMLMMPGLLLLPIAGHLYKSRNPLRHLVGYLSQAYTNFLIILTFLTLFCATIFYLLFFVSVFIHPILTLIVLALFILVQLIVLPIFNLYIASQVEDPTF
jgi:hypothetical protein